tara:strand:- start:1416 stop:1940 length:525 start_codon:yes stop_codon:yes gene_type:complete
MIKTFQIASIALVVSASGYAESPSTPRSQQLSVLHNQSSDAIKHYAAEKENIRAIIKDCEEKYLEARNLRKNLENITPKQKKAYKKKKLNLIVFDQIIDEFTKSKSAAKYKVLHPSKPSDLTGNINEFSSNCRRQAQALRDFVGWATFDKTKRNTSLTNLFTGYQARAKNNEKK